MSDNSKSKIIRNTVMVPWEEVKPLLDQACSEYGATENQIMETIGYSAGSARDWERVGQLPLRTKYAVLGFLFEGNITPVKSKTLTHEEIVILFSCVNNLPVQPKDRRKITAKLSQMLVDVQ